MAESAAAATPTGDGGASPEGSDDGSGTADVAGVAPASEKPNTGTPKPGADAAGAEKPVAEPRTYKRKINGREETIPADAIDAAAKALGLDPQDLLNGSQLKKAAYERFEAARKEAERVERLKGLKDPRAIAREMLGMDEAAYRKHAEEFLLSELAREQQMAALTPEQQQYETQRQKFEAERAEFERQKAEAKEAQMVEQAQAAQARLEPAILGAIDKAGLPRTPAAVRAVVAELKAQVRYGLPLDVDAAVRDAQDGFVKPTAAILSKMPPEKLIELLGKDAYDGILRHSIAKKGEAPAPVAQAQSKPEPDRLLTPKEWDELYMR